LFLPLNHFACWLVWVDRGKQDLRLLKHAPRACNVSHVWPLLRWEPSACALLSDGRYAALADRTTVGSPAQWGEALVTTSTPMTP
jgi:hypothetical protein